MGFGLRLARPSTTMASFCSVVLLRFWSISIRVFHQISLANKQHGGDT